MDSNNNPIEKVKEEIKNAKDIITEANDKNKSIPEKMKSIVTPKNNSKNIINDSKINKEKDVISNNISNNGDGNEYSESSSNENVSNSSNQTDNNNNFIPNLNNSSNSNSDKSSNVEILDELSKSCQLAMSNISFLSTRINQSNLKDVLISIYSGYTDILSQINKNFALIGEIPSNVSPNLKMLGLCSINFNTKIDRSSSHFAEIMIQGLNMGIIKCQKLINSTNSSSIKSEILDLTKQFLDFQEQSIQKLKAFL